ncbi:type III polyketide synthase [Psychroflexus gondwanensis]|jgi:predicted naringenin-chalcone synthase|uniref:Naringenin-chalcone synthase-like protein n=1 Tax=Psychroflexus gondwanensis ACAM 44 TaxID=1189619 RepID=N1X130_9FLAO|nr:type III polyketide synthase [Psychroflexus gondwanensis]EMY81763.1 naringenin-chalcone synthase-like protein [Psychroflexus gondwanensis ACAM 44]TXE20873.1 type III polyketide synthase [Psychroflexus gondwanensis]
MSVKIETVATQNPEYFKETKDIIPFVETWLADEDERFQRKVIKIFEGAQVDKRYSIMNPEEVFIATSFEDKNRIYVREAKKLGKKVLEKALKQADWSPESLDYIITVSCTGIMIPSLDAYLINDLELRQDIVRLPVTEMGCAAGISGMIYAKQFLQANPNKRAAIVSFEAPTATFQLNDLSMANMVSSAIFGDGSACVLMSSEEACKGPEIIDESMYHFYNDTHMMGFDLTNSGLKMILDIDVPEKISDHFPDIIHPFLKANDTKIEDINHLIFHPGGKKIINTVEALFGAMGKNIDDTKEVLRLFGNMSSATVLYVLERMLKKDMKKGEKGLMLSFGPGFSAQRILLQW